MPFVIVSDLAPADGLLSTKWERAFGAVGGLLSTGGFSFLDTVTCVSYTQREKHARGGAGDWPAIALRRSPWR
ncbi:MAG: hypothetical protein AAF559_11240 [Pseudomonadota bacterium]